MSAGFIARLTLCLTLLANPLAAMPAFAQAAKPAAAAPAASDAAAKPKKAPSAKQLAAREHMKACGAEWRDIKAKGTAKDQTWRTFSKSCLSRRAEGGPKR